MPPGPKPQFTPEELKERNRIAAREYQRRKRAAQPPKDPKPLATPEELKARRAERAKLQRARKLAAETPEEAAIRRARQKETDTRWRQENREAFNAHQRERRANDRERYRETNRRWYAAHREQAYLAGLDSGKRYRVKVRLAALRAYSKGEPVCVCCGETTLEFLALDHTEGSGNKHRKEVGTLAMADWAKRNGYPPIFQVLCHNCNLAKGFYGQCPHQGYTG